MEKDAGEKLLEEYNDVFADIVNVLLFDGREVLKPNELEDDNMASQYKMAGALHEQERDVAKFWKRGGIRIALYGLENQTAIDADMPLRVIGYDGAVYRGQLLNDKARQEKAKKEGKRCRSGKRYPVVTLVLYFGNRRWQKNKSLLERLTVPEVLKPFVSDYKLNIFEIPQLTPEQVQLFKSDFKIVADFFVQKRINKSYKPSKEQINHVDAILKLMNILTEDNRFTENLNELYEKKEAVTMCNIIDQYEKRGERRGERRGKKQINLLNRILIKAKRFADLERATNEPEYQQQLMKELLPAN